MRAQKALSHVMGVLDFFEKKWCNLVHSRAHFSLHNFATFRLNHKKNVAFADKSEKEKK